MFNFLRGIKRSHLRSPSKSAAPASASSPAEDGGTVASSSSSSSVSPSRDSKEHKGDAPRVNTRESSKQHRHDATPRRSTTSHSDDLQESGAREKGKKREGRCQQAETMSDVPEHQRISSTASRSRKEASQQLKRRIESASPASVERLLARYPPAGSPAAAAAAAAEEDRQDREASPPPPSTSHSARVKRQSHDLNGQRSNLPPSPRRSSPSVRHVETKTNEHGNSRDGHPPKRQQQQQEKPQQRSSPPVESTRAGAASKRPLGMTNDAVFMQYLRQTSPLSGDDHDDEKHRTSLPNSRSPMGIDSSGAHAPSRNNNKNNRNSPSTSSGEDVARESEDGQKREPLRPQHHRQLAGKKTRSFLKTGAKGGAVAYSSSSSTDSHLDSSEDSNRGEPPSRRVVTPRARVDARKVFKRSPDQEEDPARLSQQQQQQRDAPLVHENTRDVSPRRSSTRQQTSEKELRRRASASTASTQEKMEAATKDLEAALSPRASPQHVHAFPTPPPLSLRPRHLNAYATTRASQVSFASDSEADGEPEQASVRRKRPARATRRSARSKSAYDDDSDGEDQQHQTTDRRISTPSQQHADSSSSTPSPSGDPQQAWTFMDMSTNITSHRLHRHRHEHVPHHKAPPAPSPMGTRRLHTAWVSYLQHHGQSHANQHDRDADSPAQLRCWEALSDTQPVEMSAGVDKAHTGQVVPHAASAYSLKATTPAESALVARLRDRDKEVLLLRASLLMTYTLLAAGGDTKLTQRLTASAPGRKWEHEVGRYAGWTAAAESRQQRAIGREDDGEGYSEEEEDVPHVVARTGSTSHRSSASNITPWPALAARLDASVRAAAQHLTATSPSSLNEGRLAERRGSVNRERASGGGSVLPPPRLLLRETPAHDMKGLPSLWYPPHLSDAVGPVSGVLSVWFSRGGKGNDGDAPADEEKEGEEGGESEVGSQAGWESTHMSDASTHQRSRSGLLSLFSRSSSAGRGRTPTRARSAPARRASRSRKSSAPSSTSSSMKGTWRRCFVVADDREVRIYPTERDYVDFASERLLMAVPYTSLAYLIPDFVEAAAALAAEQEEDAHSGSSRAGTGPSRGAFSRTPSALTAVHVCTIAAVGAGISPAGGGGGGGKSGDSGDVLPIHFGFVHRQTLAVEQHVAASLATGPSFLQALRARSGRSGPSLHFAPWRIGASAIAKATASLSRRSALRPHPPLLFRTQSRLAHAEWVHFFAYKFNRHLYGLLFPTTCAAMAEVGLRNKAAQTEDTEVDATGLLEEEGKRTPALQARVEAPQEHEGRGRGRRRRRHSRHRSRGNSSSSSSSSSHRRRRSSSDTDNKGSNGDEDDDGADHSRRDGTAVSNASAPARSSAPPSPPDISNQFTRALQHANEDHLHAEERASLLRAAAELRRAVEQRDAQLRSLEAEQTALTKSLRQRERQVHDLQHDQIRLRESLQDALAHQQHHGVEENQRDEMRRLRAVADAAALNASLRPGNHRDDNNVDSVVARALHDAEEAHARDVNALQSEIEDLQRRYSTHQAAWRAEQQSLEARCRLTEMQVQNLREDASHQIHSLAHQVVRDLDAFHDEVTHGTERCVNSMLHSSRHLRKAQRQLQVPPHLYDAERSPPRVEAAVASTTQSPSGVAGGTRAIASLLLTYHEGHGSVVEGELTVDESTARMLFSGPTANQRGRRWELRHHATDALLRIQLELLSRAPGDRRTSPHASPVALLHGPSQQSRGSSRTASPRSKLPPPPPPPPPPPLSALHSAPVPHRRTPSMERRSPSSAAHTPLSSVLRAVNVAPRDTRASRLRQAAIERQIQERELLDEA